MRRLRTITLVLLVFPAAAYAVPEYMNYQARIFDASGQPLQGTHALSFAIYDATGTDASATESLLWGPFVCDGLAGEGHAARVTVWDGWFNVILGPKDTVGRSITSAFTSLDQAPRFIEITVEGETISPRQQFLSSPYAMQSLQAEYAVHGVPPGSIIAYFGTSPPLGWLMCDGSPVPNGARYDALRSLVGQNTPDLRGRFILMADPSARVLSASPVFSATGGEESHVLTVPEIPAHNHTFSVNEQGCPDGGTDVCGYGYWSNLRSDDSIEPTTWVGGNQAHNNMPPFFALNWIIKY